MISAEAGVGGAGWKVDDVDGWKVVVLGIVCTGRAAGVWAMAGEGAGNAVNVDGVTP